MVQLKPKIKGLAQSLLNKKMYEIGRRAFHKIKPLPNFLIVGTQRGGTTSLYRYLTSHPQIYGSAKKELYFFDYNFSKGVTWYRRYFPFLCRIKPNLLTGEASPGYLYYSFTAKRIASLIPEVKLIILLRNPVDRAISQYWHEVKGGWEDLPMREAFNKEDERLEKGEKKRLLNNKDYSFAHKHYSYLDRGKYARQVGRYFNHFERDQILILKSEEFFESTQLVFDKTVRFLGLHPHTISSFKHHNAGIYLTETAENLRKELDDYFHPYNEQLYKMLDTNFGW